ncbi:hypothetical protein BO71DRAFT_34044 [Aspergillus ellipticus CBS 707.79]|uniref:Uncharacterized protein n=1 Tax=Aspergillus ellipticus CBS 707.79 TaxID=1448320 RepID=A0A319DQ59_9EURO|nr:hypothetical protein BO71DRAFT_34044 [Aspergillus ellipticus CBS 707.79]
MRRIPGEGGEECEISLSLTGGRGERNGRGWMGWDGMGGMRERERGRVKMKSRQKTRKASAEIRRQWLAGRTRLFTAPCPIGGGLSVYLGLGALRFSLSFRYLGLSLSLTFRFCRSKYQLSLNLSSAPSNPPPNFLATISMSLYGVLLCAPSRSHRSICRTARAPPPP